MMTPSMNNRLTGMLLLLVCSVTSLSIVAAERLPIPAGEYRALFATPEQKAEQLKSFWLDRLPVSNGQFAAFVANQPRWQRGRISALFADSRYLQSWSSDGHGHYSPRSEELQAAVTHVSWFAAKAYCQARGGRLPTTAEWEYVAATGSADPQADEKQILAWYSATTPAIAPATGQREPNRYGVQDMHGLIWEWTQDFNSAMTTGESRGDSAIDNQFFCGSAAAGSADPSQYAAFMRYALRSSLQANYTVVNLGFRCAYDNDNEESP
jgi:formylglycine-generating enzyme